MALIAYARVSTIEQNPYLQISALRAAGAERVYVDRASGSSMARPELTKALDHLRAGDTFMVWRLDRFGRSVRDLLDQAEQLQARGVQLRSLTEAIDTSTPGGQMVFTVLAAVAQLERDLIRDRTLAGLAEARRQGRLGGRPRVVTPERVVLAQHLRTDGATLDTIDDVADRLDAAAANYAVSASATHDRVRSLPALASDR